MPFFLVFFCNTTVHFYCGKHCVPRVATGLLEDAVGYRVMGNQLIIFFLRKTSYSKIALCPV